MYFKYPILTLSYISHQSNLLIFYSLWVFSQYIFLRLHVPPYTKHTTYFEHHLALERVAWPGTNLSILLFRGWREILLSHINAHDSGCVNTDFGIRSLRYVFGLHCASWMRLVSHQRVSIRSLYPLQFVSLSPI